MIITVIEKSKAPPWHFKCSDRFKLSKIRVRLGEYDFKKVMIVKTFVIWCLICSEFLCLPSYDWQWLSILKWLESRLKVSFLKIYYIFLLVRKERQGMKHSLLLRWRFTKIIIPKLEINMSMISPFWNLIGRQQGLV